MDLFSDSQELELLDNITDSKDTSLPEKSSPPENLISTSTYSVVPQTTMPEINTSRGHLLHTQHQNSRRSSVTSLVGSSGLGSSTGQLGDLNNMGISNTWTDEEPVVFPSSITGPSVLDNCILQDPPCFWEMSDLDPQSDAVHNNSPLNGTLFSGDTEPARLEDHSSKSGVCGLRNLGNTCFLNSGLQCLLNNSKIVQFFLETYDLDDNSKESLTGRFAQLVSKVWSGQHSFIKPVDFKEALGRCHPQFRDYRQHDCQEFLALLLDTLHEQLNIGNEAKSLTDIGKDTCIDLSTQMDADDVVIPDAEGDTKCSLVTVKRQKMFQLLAEVKDNCSLTSGHATSDNSTSTSPRSTDSFGSWDTNPSFRMHPVPEDVKPFQDVTVTNPSLSLNASVKTIKGQGALNPSVIKKPMADLCFSKNDIKNSDLDNQCNSNLISIESLRRTSIVPNSESIVKKPEKNELAVCLINSGIVPRKIPTMEDFAKETKTLNTNVLVSEEINNALKFDSEKFPKKDPPFRPRETLDNLHVGTVGLEADEAGCSLVSSAAFKLGSSALKRVKDTNIQQEEASKELNNSDNVPKRMKIEKGGLVENGGKSEGDGLCKMKTERDDGDDVDALKDLSKEDNIAADCEWANYRSKNQSVVVDTFQGQFRSTVICSECGYVSVTFEPFMYLAVPLPHALERQITITFVPLETRSLVRYLVTVHKNDKLYKVKEALMAVLATSKAKSNEASKTNCTILPQELVLTEVFDNHISKILEDSILVRHINDSNREVYAFEISTTPKQALSTSSSYYNESAKGGLSLLNNQHAEVQNENSSISPLSSGSLLQFNYLSATEPLDSSDVAPSLSSFSLIQEGSKLSDGKTRSFMPEIDLNKDSDIPSTSGISENAFPMPSIHSASSTFLGGGDSGDLSPKVEGPKWESWHTCAICLEDIPDEQLKTHPPCQCILCHNCITMSCRHYGTTSLLCPVCSVPVKPDEEFVPFLNIEDYKAKVRLIAVPIVFRTLELGQMKLIGHPGLLRLPDNVSAGFLYENVDKCVPYPSPYSLHFVDGQGKTCSRCIYTSKCSGCEVARVGDITLLPGDNLAVTFEPLSMDYPVEDSANIFVEDDYSMSLKRHDTETLTLYDCLKAFSESETLDEQNPWYCPMCRRNRQAIKSLSVWRCPDTLMVYLKRFMFHEFSSTKVDDKVLFPLEGLDLSPFVTGLSKVKSHLNNKGPDAGALSSDYSDCHYDLQACVCHFGGVSSGHYTAYSKHCITGEWHYYNDDATREQKPQDEDHVHAYILFYQRPGTGSCSIPSLAESGVKSGQSNMKANENMVNPQSETKKSEGINCRKTADLSPDDGSCSSLCLKPDTITHILKQLEDCGESEDQDQQFSESISSKKQSNI